MTEPRPMQATDFAAAPQPEHDANPFSPFTPFNLFGRAFSLGERMEPMDRALMLAGVMSAELYRQRWA